MDGLPGMTSTKPATVEIITPLLGTSQTFIVRTFRQQQTDEDGKPNPATFTVFLKYIEGTTATKLAIPARVADLIARQREALTDQARRKAGKRAAATRKERGIVSTFGRRKR